MVATDGRPLVTRYQLELSFNLSADVRLGLDADDLVDLLAALEDQQDRKSVV